MRVPTHGVSSTRIAQRRSLRASHLQTRMLDLRRPNVSPMQLTLVISGLLDLPAPALCGDRRWRPCPDAAARRRGIAFGRSMTAASRWFARRSGSPSSAIGPSRHRSPAAAGIDTAAAYWLCAEPATFEVGRGDVRLAGMVRRPGGYGGGSVAGDAERALRSERLRFDAPDPATGWSALRTAQIADDTAAGTASSASRCWAAYRKAPTGSGGAAGRTKSRCCCSSTRSTSHAKPPGAPWSTASGSGVAAHASRPLHMPRIAALYANAWLPRELARATGVVAQTSRVARRAASTNRRNRRRWSGSTPAATTSQQLANWLAASSIAIGQRRRAARFTTARYSGLDIVAGRLLEGACVITAQTLVAGAPTANLALGTTAVHAARAAPRSLEWRPNGNREARGSGYRARARCRGLTPLFARIYAARGVNDAADLEHELARLPEWSRIDGHPRRCGRGSPTGSRAMKRMLIVADYDADGATACAVGVRGLRAMGATVDFLVPNRFEFGYGLTPEIVALAATRATRADHHRRQRHRQRRRCCCRARRAASTY